MKYIFHIAAAVIVALGFVLFMPSDPTVFYYSSMVYSLVLVLVSALSAYCNRQTDEEHTSQFGVLAAQNTMMYVVGGALWMVVCALLGFCFETGTQMRIFVMGVLIYSFLYFLYATHVSKHDSSHASYQGTIVRNTEDIRQLVMMLESMAEQHRTPENSQKWDSLIRQVKSYPPSRYNAQYAESVMSSAELLKTN